MWKSLRFRNQTPTNQSISLSMLCVLNTHRQKVGWRWHWCWSIRASNNKSFFLLTSVSKQANWNDTGPESLDSFILVQNLELCLTNSQICSNSLTRICVEKCFGHDKETNSAMRIWASWQQQHWTWNTSSPLPQLLFQDEKDHFQKLLLPFFVSSLTCC